MYPKDELNWHFRSDTHTYVYGRVDKGELVEHLAMVWFLVDSKDKLWKWKLLIPEKEPKNIEGFAKTLGIAIDEAMGAIWHVNHIGGLEPSFTVIDEWVKLKKEKREWYRVGLESAQYVFGRMENESVVDRQAIVTVKADGSGWNWIVLLGEIDSMQGDSLSKGMAMAYAEQAIKEWKAQREPKDNHILEGRTWIFDTEVNNWVLARYNVEGKIVDKLATVYNFDAGAGWKWHVWLGSNSEYDQGMVKTKLEGMKKAEKVYKKWVTRNEPKKDMKRVCKMLDEYREGNGLGGDPSYFDILKDIMGRSL